MKKTKTLASLLNSPADVLNRELENTDRLFARYEELRLIDEKIANRTMTDELYKFLDVNGDLQNLFKDMPKFDNVSEEALDDIAAVQQHYVEAAMEGILSSIKDALIRLWRAFCDWIDSWIDNNRRVHFRLRRHLTRIQNNPYAYGTPQSYETVKGTVYHYRNEWVKMYKACIDLASLLNKVPQNDPKAFFAQNISSLSRDLSEFGYEIDGDRVVDRGPKYIKMERAIGVSAAGWAYAELPRNIEYAMNALDVDKAARSQFKAVERAFNKAITGETDPRDKYAFTMLIKLCKCSKEFAGIIARAVMDVCVIAMRNA